MDAASVEGEMSNKLCETADATVSFKSDIRKHFGFLVSRHEKGSKGD